jgi:hypothetical protein
MALNNFLSISLTMQKKLKEVERRHMAESNPLGSS